MAVDKLVDSSQLDADLTNVADAIRTKGGTSASLAFPAGFVNAIENFESGNGCYSADSVASRNAGNYTDIELTVSAIKNYAFTGMNISSVTSESVTDVGTFAFRGCNKLSSIYLPNLAANNASAGYVFAECTSMESFHFPKVKTFGQYAFSKSGKSTGAIVLPAATVIQAYYFSNAYVGAIDLGPNVSAIGNRSLEKMPNISALILRRTASVVTIPSVQSVEASRFANGKAGATLYVPSDLISSYQAATNWSTILGYENNQILPIEGSIYESQYADGTPIS